jgi:arylsulfatase
MKQMTVASTSALKSGKSTVKLDFAYDGGGIGKGGLATLYIDGAKVGEGRIDVTQPAIFSADETADVGIDLGTPVVEAIGCEEKSRFTGTIDALTVDLRDVDAKADAAAEHALRDVAAKTE